ncbi:MAG: 6-bladed beta-propeller, partial [Cutibacterium acnes]|nr:6-bladed beta-propeller [Cutibacterium acnes]
MSPDGQFLFSLGSGNNEFGVPGDIAIGPNGNIYVTDSTSDRVKVYAANGVFQFYFGGTGAAAGQMSFPTGITVDSASQEIYVVDQTNGRVEVFDLAGLYKRVIGRFGSGAGKLTRPQGISVAGGKVYVVDAYQSSVEVFDTSGNTVNIAVNASGTPVPFIGQYGSGPGSLKVPTDAAIAGSRLFVSNTDNARVEVFEILDPQGLKTSPAVLTYSTAMGVNPLYQTIQVDPQVAGNAVAWTASVSAPFISLSQTSGTAPVAVNVSIDTTNMAAGTYTGSVIFHSNGNNVDYSVAVSLTIIQPQLSVSSAGIDMTYRKGSGLPAAQSITVDSTGGSVQWVAVTDALWINLSGTSGTTPAVLSVSANQNVDAMSEGQYNVNVTITAPAAANSPAVVPVRLRVVVAGTVTVTTNLDAATFALTGPVIYSGSGKAWTMDEVKAGTYTVEFGTVKGYRKPATRTVTVQSGQTITIDGQYQPNVANAIIAAKGPDPKNDALVRVLDLNGSLINEFKAFTSKYGARVATGDVDGDGSDEIIVAPGPGSDNKASVKIFR